MTRGLLGRGLLWALAIVGLGGLFPAVRAAMLPGAWPCAPGKGDHAADPFGGEAMAAKRPRSTSTRDPSAAGPARHTSESRTSTSRRGSISGLASVP